MHVRCCYERGGSRQLRHLEDPLFLFTGPTTFIHAEACVPSMDPTVWDRLRMHPLAPPAARARNDHGTLAQSFSCCQCHVKIVEKRNNVDEIRPSTTNHPLGGQPVVDYET